MRHVVITKNINSGELDVRLDFTTSNNEVPSQSSVGDDTEIIVCSESFDDIFENSIGEATELSATLIETLLKLGDDRNDFEDALRTLLLVTLRKGVALGKADEMITNS